MTESFEYLDEIDFVFLSNLGNESGDQAGILVPDGKGQGQQACQKEWKKCEEENE